MYSYLQKVSNESEVLSDLLQDIVTGDNHESRNIILLYLIFCAISHEV